jgi:hypothetical protein
MSPWLLMVCLGAEPSAEASLVLDRLRPVLGAGWTSTESGSAVTLTRETPAMVQVRGLGGTRPALFSLRLTVGARLTPKARAQRLRQNERTRRAREVLEQQMQSFATHATSDSEPDFAPTTPQQRALLDRYEALTKAFVEVPGRYVGDFRPVTISVFFGDQPRRLDETCEEACERAAGLVAERLSAYEGK